MATDSLCLENIDEFIHDENKIVTCKWLSLTLKIHINQAKRLLYTFLQQQRKKHKDVNATYFVAGLSKGDNGHLEHRCLVVTEEDLDTTRGQLSTVTSCHVYSIQRANLKDSNSLYMTDYEGVRENLPDCNKYSSIHCQRAAVPRSQPTRKTASPDKPRSSQSTDKGGKGDAQKPMNGSGADKSASVGPQGSKGKKPEPKGSIASMFAQSSKNKDAEATKKKETVTKEVAKENKPAAKNKKGGVMDLFANAKPAAKAKAPAEEKKETTVSKERKDKTSSETKSKKSRPKEDSDSDDQPEKKRRRRIKNDLFDSSSEDEEMEIQEESPVPSPVREPSPEPEPPVPSKKTPEKRPREASPPQEDRPANSSKQRRRRRKLVPKTYLDEDGFMVTEKVWESESTDASEVEEEAKKKAAPKKKPEPAPAKKASPQKKTSPVKGKQTSLMSFFKKK
ncbi:DNA polymerase delta subunit 3-like [Babylonia areolata]|uniref:DNA polymerase delta subunit 3-like n=1 Tax=Babylonia areolata TaxID=304850 RepID=UPI003FD0F270